MTRSAKQAAMVTMLVAVGVWATEPNYVRVTTYAQDQAITNPSDPGYVHEPLVGTTYSDGLGRETQVQAGLAGYPNVDALVTMTRYDDVGRACTTYQSAPVQSGSLFVPYETFKTEVASYRATSGAHPFSQVQYWNDPLGRTRAAGASGAAFSLDATAGHPVKTWYVGVTPGGVHKTWYTSDGFAKLEDRVAWYWETHLDALVALGTSAEADPTDYSSASNYADPTHFLTIAKDANGSFTQELRDALGRVVKRAAGHRKVGDTYYIDVISRYTYDILGNVIEEIAPTASNGDVLVGNSTCRYNTLGQPIEKSTPDAGMVQYRYEAGRLASYTDAQMAHLVQAGLLPPVQQDHPITGLTMDYQYDALGRVVLVYQWHHGLDLADGFRVKTRSVYDDPLRAQPYVAGIPAVVDVLDDLHNTRGHLAVSIAYCEECERTTSLDVEPSCDKVIDAFSYDNEGQVETKYKYVPGAPLQTFTYTHALNGKLRSETYNNGSRVIVTSYRYDNNGRLAEVNRDGKSVAQYTYLPDGKLSNKGFKRGSDGSVRVGVAMAYNERDWLRTVAAGQPGYPNYTQNIAYNSAEGLSGVTGLQPQYDGNVSYSGYLHTGVSATNLYYQYDNVNRLTKIRTGDGARLTNGSPITDAYDANLSFDNAGRFVEKHEGTDATGWGQYSYAEVESKKTSRLVRVPGKHADEVNYLYDANGNMVLDKSKKMGIIYDWRNLPVMFKFYASIPANVSRDDAGSLDTRSHDPVPLLSYVVMRYDAAGARVMKQTFEPGAGVQ
jgi:antitoxin component YwqK of YwqJK toxin-antitoxin module